MNIIMKQYVDGLYLENYQDIVYLDIKYGGSFNAQMVSDCDVYINDKNIIIYNIELHKSGLLMNYNGNFIITGVLAYTQDKARHYVPTRRIIDEWGKVDGVWDNSTTTWESHDKSNRKKKRVQTSIGSVVGSNKKILIKRGINVRNSS